MLRDLRHRDRQPEVMDQPGLDGTRHHQALIGLRRINRISRTAHVLWSRIYPLAQNRSQPLTVLDVACGGGDVAIALCHLADRAKLKLTVTGCDISQTALDYARSQASRAGVDVRWIARNVLIDGIDQDYDVIVCSLFLHHLDEEDTVKLLSEMSRHVRSRLLASDLVRSQWGYFLASVGGRLITRSPVVHTDGPLSVRAAYTPPELRDVASQAGLKEAIITRRWPARMLLEWNPS